MTSLTNYLKYLKPGEPLFIHLSKKQWDRKDVYRAVGKLSTHFGIEGIYPRRIRSTVASQMLRMGILLKDVSGLLRHKDIATTLQHYAGIVEMENISYALNQYQPTKPMPKFMHYSGVISTDRYSFVKVQFQKELRLVCKPHFRNHVPANRYRKLIIALCFIRLGESISDITLFQLFGFKALNENLHRVLNRWLREYFFLHTSLGVIRIWNSGIPQEFGGVYEK